MPEGLEAEIWRSAAEVIVGRTVRTVWFDDRVAPADLGDALVGCAVTGVGRRGKVVLVETDGPTLGLHFGMTGRLIVDGTSPIGRLEYASGADRPEWDRLRLATDDSDATSAPALRLNDPRRLGRLSLDPDLTHHGPEASTLTADRLSDALAGRTAAVKALLLDQAVVAGLGNLCADEVLFTASVHPGTPADRLDANDVERLAAACRERLADMLAAGGSTSGVLDPVRRAELGRCPLDVGELRRTTIGGRTAVWCSHHQAPD